MENKDDPGIAERRAKRQKALDKKNIADLTIAERLTRKALHRTIKVPFIDDGGTFDVEVFVPLREDLDAMLSWKVTLEAGTPEEMEKTADKLFAMLGALCKDASLNYEFFKEGGYDPIDLLTIVESITDEMAQKVREARSFRR